MVTSHNERPAQSPDLKPMELVGDEPGRKQNNVQVQHLWQVFQKCWEEFSNQDLISIIKRMKPVCLTAE